MSLLGEGQSLFVPPVPRDLEGMGISLGLVTDLFLRRLSVEGTTTLQTLSGVLKIPIQVLLPIFTSLRQQQFIEVKGMVGNDYRISLSGGGRTLATERLQLSQYSGAAPVSLKAYSEAVKMQAPEVEISRDVLRTAFSDLVVPDGLLDQIGPALIEQSSIFLYGPPGNGKSSLAERLLRVYEDSVLIPYAIEVDGQVIAVYDPAVHQRLGDESEERDPRWVVCRRPCIIVGGELTLELLELRYDDSSGVYSAPLQMKANNGIFVIDDFGRQHISPRELLNRWIVPLDRHVDYLSLRYGLKFEIPFQPASGFCDKSQAERTGRRGVSAPHPQQDLRGPGFPGCFRRDLPARGLLPVSHSDSREFRGVPGTLPGGRSKRIARVLSQRHLQDSELDCALRKPQSGGDPAGPGACPAALLHVGIEEGCHGRSDPWGDNQCHRQQEKRER